LESGIVIRGYDLILDINQRMMSINRCNCTQTIHIGRISLNIRQGSRIVQSTTTHI